MISAFGVDHGGEEFSKLSDKQKQQATVAGAGTAGAAGVGVLAHTKMPEHSHYDKKTRKYLHSLPAGEHDVPTKMLAKRPRKLGARKQQTPYVATMARERPLESFKASPVPVTRYKGGHVIQRDSAHSVQANAMKGRKTRIKIEDAPGHRPTRRTGEELVRRGQMRFQEQRLKRNFDIGEKAIKAKAKKYKESSRKANTAKRPHGVAEEQFKFHPKKYGVKQALGAGRNVAMVAKREDKRQGRRDVAAGVAGAGGAGALAATPVRRSGAKVNIKEGQISAADAKKIASPGYRPGNKKAIKVMARNLGHLENQPTTVIRYKDKTTIPFDGNHRMTARVARGDKKVPVRVIEGGQRPSVSVTRDLYHRAQQKVHRERMDRGTFDISRQETNPKSERYIGRHAGPSKTYSSISNASPSRSGRRIASGSMRAAKGPSTLKLRTKQGVAVTAGTGLLGTAAHLHRKKD